MKKLRTITTLVAVIALSSFSGIARAEGGSAKATAAVADIKIVEDISSSESPFIGDWVNILSTGIRTANQKDLLVGVSLEIGLITQTLIASSQGVSDTSKASGMVEIRVLVDGQPIALPTDVVFARRTQTMTGVLSGLCAVRNEDGTVSVDEECTKPETLDLVLDTMNAHSYNFIIPDLSSDRHVLEVQARINLEATSDQGSARAQAYIGKGSVCVEEVRFVKGQDIEI